MPALLAFCVFLSASPQGPHPKPFWRSIVAQKFAVPPGETAAALAAELVASLGSPDPEMRDDLAFTILSSWIYGRKLLSPADLRPIVRTLQGHLSRDLTTPGTETVLLRSFSALTLSVAAARDNAEPFLTADEFNALVEAALAYFRDEPDIRGFDAQKGWLHTAAHTADLLKFLARSPRLRAADQARMLTALTAKNRDAAAAFSQGEDERMARVVISIVRRPDFDRGAFTSWLAGAQAAAKFPDPPGVAALRAQQNVRHLLASLWTALSVDERPAEGADFARSALREALKTLY
jgi:uncharacterized protein DUF2785